MRWLELADVASERLGGAAIECSDDFFAPKENLVRAKAPIFIDDEYTDRGKWMDGWESRRKRTPGHDWCIVRLGAPAIARGFVVDTSFFRGNFPSHASIDGRYATEDWIELLPKSELRGDAKNNFEVSAPHLVTHVRLNIFPDGGVARLRVHGDVVPDLGARGARLDEFDAAAIENGGASLSCSDMFFGIRHNLLMPGRAANMGDGWETRRRRGPGFDWNLVALAGRTHVREIEIDTNHFKGNYPDTCSIEACDAIDPERADWREILPKTKMKPHHRHFFSIAHADPITHVKLCVYPDGGVSRLRVLGSLTGDARTAIGLARINAFPAAHAERELSKCCASKRWAHEVVRERPFASEDALASAGDRVWSALSREDWLEAFAAHPRIGERGGGEKKEGWSADEQRGTKGADAKTLEDLRAANARYEERFGHVFLVCATGKTASEMLRMLNERMQNTHDAELKVAASEHAKITPLRLPKPPFG